MRLRRSEVHEIFERIDRQLRDVDLKRRMAAPVAKRLQTERDALAAKLAPLTAAMKRLERRAKALGYDFRDYEYDGQRVGAIFPTTSGHSLRPTAAHRRFARLKDEWRIAQMGSTPEDVKQQQRVLREIAKLAEANQ